MGSKYKVKEQPYESLDEISLNNLKRLTGFPLEMVRKLCNSGTEVSLDNDELMEMLESKVVKKVGIAGIKNLHHLGELEKITFEELRQLHYSAAPDLLDVTRLRKLCKSGAILGLPHNDFEKLSAMMHETEGISVEDIIKLSITGALSCFCYCRIMDLMKNGYFESLSTENLKKYCDVSHIGINYINTRKILDNQEIITRLNTTELGELCNDKQFLDEVTGEELLNVVRSGKYTTTVIKE